jgi:hypothetical protein
MKFSLTALLFLTVVLAGCDNVRKKDLGFSTDTKLKYLNVKHEVDVTIRVPGILSAMRKNSLVRNFRMVKLETTPECLIGNIEQLYQFDGYIFIFDRNNNSILKFDNQGHFLKKVGRRGQGPSEYINLVDVDLNKSNKTISALDLDGRKIIAYDFEGNVISKKKITFLFDAHKFKDNQVYLNTGLYTNVANPDVDLNQLIVSDTALNPHSKSFAYSKTLRKSEFVKSAQSPPLRVFNNQLYYYNILSPDTIWNLNKSTKSPAYVLSFPKKYFQDLDQLAISKMIMEKKNQAFEGAFYISKDFACFGIIEKSRYIYPLLYSISTGHIMYGGTTGDFNLPGTPPQRVVNLIGDVLPGFVLDNGDFCKVWQPFDLKIINSWDDKRKKLLYGPDKKFIDELKEDDNPVLFLYNFEKF